MFPACAARAKDATIVADLFSTVCGSAPPLRPWMCQLCGRRMPPLRPWNVPPCCGRSVGPGVPLCHDVTHLLVTSILLREPREEGGRRRPDRCCCARQHGRDSNLVLDGDLLLVSRLWVVTSMGKVEQRGRLVLPAANQLGFQRLGALVLLEQETG